MLPYYKSEIECEREYKKNKYYDDKWNTIHPSANTHPLHWKPYAVSIWTNAKAHNSFDESFCGWCCAHFLSVYISKQWIERVLCKHVEWSVFFFSVPQNGISWLPFVAKVVFNLSFSDTLCVFILHSSRVWPNEKKHTVREIPRIINYPPAMFAMWFYFMSFVSWAVFYALAHSFVYSSLKLFLKWEKWTRNFSLRFYT